MGLEGGWCHALKRWSWEFEDFEKTIVEYSTIEGADGFSTDQASGWVFRISTSRDEMRSKTSQDAPPVEVGSA